MLKIIPVVTRLQAGFFPWCVGCAVRSKKVCSGVAGWVLSPLGSGAAESTLRGVTLEGETAGHGLNPGRAVECCVARNLLFSTPLSCCVVLLLTTGKESRFRETGFVLTLTLQTKENADKKILFDSRCKICCSNLKISKAVIKLD